MTEEAFDDSPAVVLKGEVTSFFGSDTPLKRADQFGGRKYEERPQQREMAETIAECFERNQHLLVEAPTGVGKSFAYLIPAIFLARKIGKPVVISTHTIALQEQLMQKDIPLLRKLLDLPIKAAIAKGRQNYICLQRLGNCQAEMMDYLPNLDMAPELSRIARWAQSSNDGSLADLDFKPGTQLWQSLCSEPGVCPREARGNHAECFFQRARKRLYSADIIVANHAMLCSDLAMRRMSEGEDDDSGLLPDYCAVIIDEAHTFEEMAATHMGLRLSTIGLYLTLNRLIHPKTNRGLLSKCSAETRARGTNTHGHAKRFFTRLLTWLEAQDENPLIYAHPGHIPNLLAEPLGLLVEGIREDTDDTDEEGDAARELNAAADRLQAFRDGIQEFLDMTIPDTVYWFERFGRDQQQVSMNAVPVEICDILKETFFNRGYPIVMTSATMAVNQNLDYFKERLGCPEADTLILDTPYNFEEQVDLYLPRNAGIPDPRSGDEFLDACCGHIKYFISLSEGRAFVLFTNYSHMNMAADLLAPFLDEKGYRLLVQGRDHQRSQMLEMFREDKHSVLFGTASFWMGVDVPGEALSNVILTRLPFPVPSHPLISAICERIEARGLSSFRHFSLPEAVLKFRQGFGRLIRSQDDRGIVVVLDPRIITKSYGRDFIQSLPPCRIQHF